MITFICGGVRSGKSSFAENYICDKSKNKIYLATAIAYDDEMRKRVDLHKESRSGQGWITIEKSTSITDATFGREAIVLLDCLTNLVANEMYLCNLGVEAVVSKVFTQLLEVAKQVKELVIVSNDIFSAVDDYSHETLQYMKALGRLHCLITKEATSCYELNYKIATKMKG